MFSSISNRHFEIWLNLIASSTLHTNRVKSLFCEANKNIFIKQQGSSVRDEKVNCEAIRNVPFSFYWATSENSLEMKGTSGF